MGKSNGVAAGKRVVDAFDASSPTMVVVRSVSGESRSPEGYNLYLVREPDGSEYVASAYDLKVVD